MITPNTSLLRSMQMKRCPPMREEYERILELQQKQNLSASQESIDRSQVYPPIDGSKGFEIGIALITKKDDNRHDPLPHWSLAISETGHTFETSNTASLYTIHAVQPCSDTYKQEYTREAKLVHDEKTVAQRRKLASIYRLGFVLTEDISRQRLSEFLVMFSPNMMGDMPAEAGMKLWSPAAYVLRLIYYMRMGGAEKDGTPAPCFRLEVNKMGRPVPESSKLPKPVDLLKQHSLANETDLHEQVKEDWNKYYRTPTIEAGRRVALFRI